MINEYNNNYYEKFEKMIKYNLINMKILLITFLLFVSSSCLMPQIRVKAVGDIMPGSVTPVRILPPDSGNIFVNAIGSQFTDGDIIFGNLEGAFIEEGMKPNKCSDSSRKKEVCFEFGIPPYLIKPLKKLGFNVLNNDNNHYSDYGYAGIQSTKSILRNNNIKIASPKGLVEFNLSGKKVALIPFSFEEASNSVNEIEQAKKIISDVKKNYDIVIVSFHGGAEGKSAQHVKDINEKFLGENRGNVYKFAHSVIDAGASLVIGHGPHVLRAMEIYKNRLIAYSMGNFLTYGNFNIQGITGVSAILTVDIDTNSGDFIKGYVTPVVQKSHGIPYYDSDKKSIKIIQQLMKEDIPNSSLEINADGLLLKKEK